MPFPNVFVPWMVECQRQAFRQPSAGKSQKDDRESAGKTGMEQRMKEPYGKGLATHPGPGSCADGGKVMGETLTGVHAGQPLNSEITCWACRPRTCEGKAT